MSDTIDLLPCGADLASCYVLDGQTLTVYYDGRPWTYDVAENATLVSVAVPSPEFLCDGYAASCVPSMLFEYEAPPAITTTSTPSLPPTGAPIPADVAIGGAVLLVVGYALLRRRARDRRFAPKA